MPTTENNENSNSNEKIEQWLSQLKDKYRPDRKSYYESESLFLDKYLHALRSRLGEDCQLEEPINVGGTGIVFRAFHKNLRRSLVVKFNRPIKHKGISPMEHEQQTLTLMNHPNIISVVDAGIIDLEGNIPRLSYIVEPFIEEPKEVTKYFKDRLEPIKNTSPRIPKPATPISETLEREKRELLQQVLKTLAGVLKQWIDALNYVHKKGYAYLDIKPSNAMVDKNGHLYLIDFGSAQKVTGSSTVNSSAETGNIRPGGYMDLLSVDAETPQMDPVDGNESVEVIFTTHFAHPILFRLQKESPSSNRTVAPIKRSDIKYSFDYYAMGKSILHLLYLVKEAAPNDATQLSLFRSLHFLATRLLDGENQKTRPSGSTEEHNTGVKTDAPQFMDQTFVELNTADYASLKYTDFGRVIQDLEKELGLWNLESQVPELQSNAKEILRVSSHINTVLTDRLRLVIEHPLFARLKLVSQLGLVSLVYPTADHSRYDHAIGTFTYAAAYIKSLFNDSHNPIFRNLVDAEDVGAALLGALLHDLGQYPLAHDLEEVHPNLFGHSNFSIGFLDDPTPNKNGYTLKQIIESKTFGWGVSVELVKNILGAAHSYSTLYDQKQELRNFKVSMLSAIIDGPIDADKADYIERDSEECRVTYGKQLDIDRLLHVLTIALANSGQDTPHRVTVGVYQKGKASAESFGVARYLLFSSVYWHHTSRILKAMVQYAVAISLSQGILRSREREEIQEWRTPFMEFIKKLIPPFDIEGIDIVPSKGTKSAIDEIPTDNVMKSVIKEETGRDVASRWYPGIAYTDWLMLNLIKMKFCEQKTSISLIDAILQRTLYKRLATFPRKESMQFINKYDQMNWQERVKFCRKLSSNLEKQLLNAWSTLESKTISNKDELQKKFSENLVLLVDVPNPSKKRGRRDDRPLLFVPELKQKKYFEDQEPTQPSEMLTEQMMESIAHVRMLCHPDIVRMASFLYQGRSGKLMELMTTTLQEMEY